jgi:hypothetical protein
VNADRSCQPLSMPRTRKNMPSCYHLYWKWLLTPFPADPFSGLFRPDPFSGPPFPALPGSVLQYKQSPYGGERHPDWSTGGMDDRGAIA